jgi:hypothetical protein
MVPPAGACDFFQSAILPEIPGKGPNVQPPASGKGGQGLFFWEIAIAIRKRRE